MTTANQVLDQGLRAETQRHADYAEARDQRAEVDRELG
jgi:hypothetical protein